MAGARLRGRRALTINEEVWTKGTNTATNSGTGFARQLDGTDAVERESFGRQARVGPETDLAGATSPARAWLAIGKEFGWGKHRMTKPNFVGVTGLPRAGSTLLCQMLAQHPEIDCEGLSSPLCNLILGLRRMVSDDQFFLSQLDHAFETSYAHLTSAMQGFLRGWNQDCTKLAVVDKNRAWLHCVELLLQIEPEAKLLVCLRELGQIYGSIEAQHQRTIFLDFIDHLADFDRFGRADQLFAKDKTIGAPMISLHAVLDLPKSVQDHLYFVRFENLIEQPTACM